MNGNIKFSTVPMEENVATLIVKRQPITMKSAFIRHYKITREANSKQFYRVWWTHYSDVIMGTTASQITSLTIVYSTVYIGADQMKTSKLRVTGLCVGNSPVTGEFPAQRDSNAENVSIWWRHHEKNEKVLYTKLSFRIQYTCHCKTY